MKSFPMALIFVLLALATASCTNSVLHGKPEKDWNDQGPNGVSLLHIVPSTPSRTMSYRPPSLHPPRPVVSSKDLPDEGQAESSKILGEGEHQYVRDALRGLDIRQDGSIPYKKTEAETTLFVPKRPKGIYEWDIFPKGVVESVEMPTRIVLTIDNRTGEILVPADAPSLSEEELDTICRSLMDKLREERHWKLHESVWMDEVRRVSDWYYVSYRIREEPYHKDESVCFYTFWIDSRTRKVANDQCGITYTDR